MRFLAGVGLGGSGGAALADCAWRRSVRTFPPTPTRQVMKYFHKFMRSTAVAVLRAQSIFLSFSRDGVERLTDPERRRHIGDHYVVDGKVVLRPNTAA